MPYIFRPASYQFSITTGLLKDLNGNTPAQFLEKLAKTFIVVPKGNHEYKPGQAHEFSMYLNGKWYALEAKTGTFNDNDPIGCLDVTLLSEHVLDHLLDIKDLRKFKPH